MSGLAQILSEIERRGIVVRVEGENLRLSPRRALDNELLKSISDHKKEIMGHTQSCWPLESLEAERRFHCQPHAKLFPFIGRKVRTPAGPGTLLQVFAERATVLLESDQDKCAVFRPSDIEPALRDL